MKNIVNTLSGVTKELGGGGGGALDKITRSLFPGQGTLGPLYSVYPIVTPLSNLSLSQNYLKVIYNNKKYLTE